MGIGKRIKEQRKKLKLTQSDLSKLIEVSSQVVSNWERDYSKPDPDDIQRLSNILQVSADYILTGNEINNEDKELKLWLEYGKELQNNGYDLGEMKKLIRYTIKTIRKE